jgi:hypothetical protein
MKFYNFVAQALDTYVTNGMEEGPEPTGAEDAVLSMHLNNKPGISYDLETRQPPTPPPGFYAPSPI